MADELVKKVGDSEEDDGEEVKIKKCVRLPSAPGKGSMNKDSDDDDEDDEDYDDEDYDDEDEDDGLFDKKSKFDYFLLPRMQL